MHEPIYSIIIPHRNIPHLLQRCINSIPLRKDVEVIVIDDCSDANYREDLVKIRDTHPNVRFVMNSQCRGGGAARNLGLEHVTGKYVIFADADDYFNDCFDDILNDYKQADYDLIFFRGNSVDSETYLPANRASHLNKYVDAYLSGEDKDGQMLRYLFGEPWARFVKRSVIKEHNVRFDETLIHNDTTFAYLVGYYGKSMCVDDRELYCVTVRRNSVSQTSNIDNALIRIEVFGRAEQFLMVHGIKVIPNKHFVKLDILLTHFHFNTVQKGIRILRKQGFSYSRILRRMMDAFLVILKEKIQQTKSY